jgi:hypothetical protein
VAVRDEPATLRWLVSATLLLSFAHQPLTLWLVYGDVARRRAHARMVVWAPLVLALAVVIGMSTSPALVAFAAGVGNAAHTLRQRYGMCKLYGRLSGFDCSADHRVLWAWLATAVLVAFARTDVDAAARSIGLGGRNRAVFQLISPAREAVAWLVPLAVVVMVSITVHWVRHELRRAVHSATRLSYLGSTAVMFVVLAFDPVVGFVAYVGSHAVEYVLVVRWRVERTASVPGDDGAVARLARRVGGAGTLLLYAPAVAALMLTLHVLRPAAIVPVVALTLGGMHLLFDTVIWRTPRPVRARTG